VRVLVTGAAGFVGRAVLRHFTADGVLPAEGVALRALVHRSELAAPIARRVEIARGDLGAPATLNGVCDGVDALVHLAVRISDDPAECETVNAIGTERLVEQARTAGVKRVVYLSNCAIYGWAVHRGVDEEHAVVAPVTPISRSRVRAERAVLAGGGTVLRPLFAYGDGDTRFVPALLRAARRLPFLVDGGRARLSVISVDELARAIVRIVVAPWVARLQGAFHINDAAPVSFLEILQALSRTFDIRLPRRSLPYALVRHLVRFAPAITGVTSRSASGAHRLFLVSRDHWYDAGRLRSRIGLAREAPLVDRLDEYADWYRPFVQRR
jgi:nucleoside-diphosphate-sugar epimerase